jgi:hypothetical protein
VAIDRSSSPNHFYAVDTANSRVLGFSHAKTFANGGAADLVIGQPDFFTATCNTGGNIEVIRQFLEVQIDLVEEPKRIWTISFDGAHN